MRGWEEARREGGKREEKCESGEGKGQERVTCTYHVLICPLFKKTVDQGMLGDGLLKASRAAWWCQAQGARCPGRGGGACAVALFWQLVPSRSVVLAPHVVA